MSEQIDLVGIKIPKSDWDATPASVRAATMITALSALSAHLSRLERENSVLRERVTRLEEHTEKPIQFSSPSLHY